MYTQPSNALLISLAITYITGIWYYIQVDPVFAVSFIITTVLLFRHYARNY